MSTLTYRQFMEFARCRGNKEINFHSDNMRDMKIAINFCQLCPVQEACLNYSIENRIFHGVWGGMTARQRQIIAGNRSVKNS